jgi:Fe-S-cluster containining protein
MTASIPGGEFTAWLANMRAAIAGKQDSKVPCGTCTACCTSSQFVHIGPDETDTLAHIDARLLFPAPRMPRGHVVMGYDERGHCPMLIDDVCSIYEHRPRTCRTYDCRVFPAAGIEPDKPRIRTSESVGVRLRRRPKSDSARGGTRSSAIRWRTRQRHCECDTTGRACRRDSARRAQSTQGMIYTTSRIASVAWASATSGADSSPPS